MHTLITSRIFFPSIKWRAKNEVRKQNVVSTIMPDAPTLHVVVSAGRPASFINSYRNRTSLVELPSPRMAHTVASGERRRRVKNIVCARQNFE